LPDKILVLAFQKPNIPQTSVGELYEKLGLGDKEKVCALWFGKNRVRAATITCWPAFAVVPRASEHAIKYAGAEALRRRVWV